MNVAAPVDRDEIRRSLEALPRIVPVLLQGIARDDLRRAAPGAAVPWDALRAQLAAGDALLGHLWGAASDSAAPAPLDGSEDASVQDVVDAFAAQRVRLCGWLEEQIAARGAAVWDDVVAGSGRSVEEACAALVVADRALLVQLAAHRNWLKGR